MMDGLDIQNADSLNDSTIKSKDFDASGLLECIPTGRRKPDC